ncbi:hypothetical protein HL42_3699 [Trichophyton rubrum]|nr:hypothetical protein HL42_3699 [Trichophyton rubrum]
MATGQARQTRVERALGYGERLPSLSLFVPPHGVWTDSIISEARHSFGAAAVWLYANYSYSMRKAGVNLHSISAALHMQGVLSSILV